MFCWMLVASWWNNVPAEEEEPEVPHIFPSKVAILDDYWTQVVGIRYAQAVEKKELQTF